MTSPPIDIPKYYSPDAGEWDRTGMVVLLGVFFMMVGMMAFFVGKSGR
jgi:hypothetical protein